LKLDQETDAPKRYYRVHRDLGAGLGKLSLTAPAFAAGATGATAVPLHACESRRWSATGGQGTELGEVVVSSIKACRCQSKCPPSTKCCGSLSRYGKTGPAAAARDFAGHRSETEAGFRTARSRDRSVAEGQRELRRRPWTKRRPAGRTAPAKGRRAAPRPRRDAPLALQGRGPR